MLCGPYSSVSSMRTQEVRNRYTNQEKNDSWSKVSYVNYFIDFNVCVCVCVEFVCTCAIWTITFPCVPFIYHLTRVLDLRLTCARSNLLLVFFSPVCSLFDIQFTSRLISSLLHKHFTNIKSNGKKILANDFLRATSSIQDSQSIFRVYVIFLHRQSHICYQNHWRFFSLVVVVERCNARYSRPINQ